MDYPFTSRDDPSSFITYRYSIKSVAKKIGIKYKKLYQILRERKVLDNCNLPDDKYIERGIMEIDYVKLNNGRSHPMSLIRGRSGIDFIKDEVKKYFEENPKKKASFMNWKSKIIFDGDDIIIIRESE